MKFDGKVSFMWFISDLNYSIGIPSKYAKLVTNLVKLDTKFDDFIKIWPKLLKIWDGCLYKLKSVTVQNLNDICSDQM